MKKIIALIQPFVFEQKVLMFEDDVLKMQVGATMSDIADRIVKISAYDKVEDVTLKGSIEYTAKIKEEIRTLELAEYGKSTMEINLIP